MLIAWRAARASLHGQDALVGNDEVIGVLPAPRHGSGAVSRDGAATGAVGA